jgi:hypothetical protein
VFNGCASGRERVIHIPNLDPRPKCQIVGGLFRSGVDIIKIKESGGHRLVTRIPIFDKRRRSTKEGPLHGLPI